MASLNKASLIGYVGKDPDIKIKQNGDVWALLSLATSESWKDKQTGERKEAVEWHKIVIHNKYIAEMIKNYVKKGSKIYIEGKIKTRKWNDPNTPDIDRYTTEIILDAFNGSVVLLDSKKYDEEESPVFSKITDNIKGDPLPTFIDDEIPF